MSIERRRMMMRSRGGVLPYPYKQVEYIESTGTQYINTGLNIRDVYQDLVIEADIQITKYGYTLNGVYVPGGYSHLIGTGNHYLIYLTGTYNNKLCFANGGNTTITDRYKTDIDRNLDRHIYKLSTKDGSAWYDGNLLVSGRKPPTLKQTDSSGIGIFSINPTEQSPLLDYHRLYLYKLKTPTQELNFIPCYDVRDNTKRTAGLYDIVNNQFYANAGTGYFIVGPDV